VVAAETFPNADLASVRYAALEGMAASVGDCHTFFLPPVQTEALNETQTGSGTVGIGVELAPGPPVWIREALSGGPAEQAGLRSGDQILSVDGEDVSTFDYRQVDERLRGERGTLVSVTVSRPPAGEQVTAAMTRDLVRPPSVESEVLADGIGYLRIRAFVLGGVGEEVDEALHGFEEAGVRGWVIDVRDNPGGFLDVPTISRFVAEGVVARSLRRGGEETTEEADGSYFEPGRPAVVLLNQGSSSVAEVFAAALQDHGVAYLIGTTSRGCAGYTAIEKLGDGSSLGVTTGRNLSPLGGRPLNDPGVVPDEWTGRSVEDISEGRDPPLERAIAYLRGVLGG
jgi:carboxyl-terminal processing protease